MSIKEKKVLENLLGKNISMSVVLSLVLLSFALSWLADGVAALFPKDATWVPWIMIGISIVIITLLVSRLMVLKKKYNNNDDIDIRQISASPRKVLIVSLSYRFDLKDEGNIRNLEETNSLKKTNIATGKRDENLKSWQMPLEAINFHIEKLETLIVITSKESDAQYNYFFELLKRLYPKNINIEKVCINIHDLDSNKKGYHQISFFTKKYANREMVYDITSGTSLVTMAGSYYTLNEDRLIEYIDTTSYKVKMYNNSYIIDEEV
jgi:hypothetical protein